MRTVFETVPESSLINSLVQQRFLPRLFEYVLTDEAVEAAEAADAELSARARTQIDGCYGYWPYDTQASSEGLLASRRFESALPEVVYEGATARFSFIRRSLQRQPALNGLHLDRNSSSGIGEYDPLRQSWRVIMNLGRVARRLTYSLEIPKQLIDIGGLGTCNDLNKGLIRTATLEPRKGRAVHCLTFCASAVPHGGDDGENGHFIAAYGQEVYPPNVAINLSEGGRI